MRDPRKQSTLVDFNGIIKGQGKSFGRFYNHIKVTTCEIDGDRHQPYKYDHPKSNITHMYFLRRFFLDTLEFAHIMIDSVADKKASDILLLDLRQQSVFTDYFLLCSTSNERQLRAIADSVWDDAKQKADVVGMSIEGTPQSGWMLVDFGDLIVHIFLEEQRAYYDLEGLWSESHIAVRMP